MSAEQTLRVLIVDDEPLSLRGLRLRLEQLPQIDIVGECVSGREAVDAIESLKPDVVLLDVQMPELSGFDVIDAVGVDEMPVTIFVTAYDAHAIRAFDAHALDYLLKPVDDERFVRAVERARARVAEHNARGRELSAAIREGRGESHRIVMRDRGRVVIMPLAEIDWIDAEGDYLRVHAAGRSYLIRHTMAVMEERLVARGFARIHRSTIVNVERVREVRSDGERDYLVVLGGGTSLKMSRRYRERIPVS